MINFFTLKQLLISFFLLLMSCFIMVDSQAQNQTFGNEWIKYTQPYYKIKVAKDGIYRLDYNYLAITGLAGANPQKFQLFRRGKELAVFVNGEADGKLDAGDYLEFFGEKNDGKTDVELFQKPEYKPHHYYSLYTDTASYFLTVSPDNGKRMREQPLTGSNLTPESWHYQNRLMLYVSHYSRGYGINATDDQFPYGDRSEGFASDYFGVQSNGVARNNPSNFKVDSLLNIDTSGPEPTVEVNLIGTHFREHNVTIYAVSPAGTERALGAAVVFGPFDHVKVTYPVLFSEITTAGELNIRIKVNTKVESGSFADRIRLGYIKVRYPRKNLLANKDLYVSLPDSNKTTASYLVFEGASANTVAYDLTDQTAITRASGALNNIQKGFVFDGSAGKQRKILITFATRFYVPAPIQAVAFRQFNTGKPNYIIVSHKKLAMAQAGSANPVRDYADYRASVAGGKYDTLLAYTDQLYDQFHYGDRSPLAIRRFMQFLLARGKPEYLFLLGKGIEADFGAGNFRRNPSAYPIFDLVPTGGVPGSDVLFTADFHNNSFVPKVSTGRVSAVNGADVLTYLEKVKQHESLPPNADWRKNMLHLGGGTDQAQKTTFRNYLRGYESIAESPLLGANVESITRESTSAPTSNINIAGQVNQGLSLITFFGHSSTTVTDIDIGFVSNPLNGYNNAGKYPMILLNGCVSGNTFLPTSRSFGEDWILTPRKGAIIFVGHSNLGFTSPLNVYSRNFYATAFNDPNFFGKTIGVINQEVIKRTAATNSEHLISTAIEMVLQADPVLVLVAPDKPDYAIKDNIKLRSFNDREQLTAASDSFQVIIPVHNFGKATLDSFFVSITRNGEVVKSKTKYPAVFNQDTLIFNFNASQGRLPGINRFEVLIDSDNAIQEIEEANNYISFEFNFPTSGTLALFPVEYAIVNSPTVNLVGQATNLLQKNRDYYFELDTLSSFNSPAKKTKIVNAAALPSWTVNLLPNTTPNDSIVYFWRFRFKDLGSDEDTIWGESSFRYIPNSAAGWSQSKQAQFTRAQGQQVQLNNATKQWEFGATSKNLQLRAAGGQIATTLPPYGIIENNSLNFLSCNPIANAPNVLLTVFNNKDLATHIMPANLTAGTCGTGSTFYHFSDLRQPQNRENMRKFLEAVPTGYYVAFISVRNVPFSDFSEPLKDAIRSLGSRLIDSVKTGYPLALVGQKGSTIGSAQEATASNTDPVAPSSQTIEMVVDIKARGTQGTILSTQIGPASTWKSIHQTVKSMGSDRYTLQVAGYNLEGKNKTILYEKVTGKEMDISAIDAKRFPYLQLMLQVTDSVDRTAPQLKEWIVLYDGVPEGVVRADLVGIEKYADFEKQAAKGKIELKYAFQNISNQDFTDSLLTRLTLVGTNGFSKDIKIQPLKQNEVAYVPFTLPTNNLSGKYNIRFTANPLFSNSAVQPEQYYSNNTLEVPFTINTNIHPVLDVVFDGRRIMDGEIVSPSPLISMSLKDEDQYTLLKDRENMQVFLKKPNSPDFTQVDLVGSDIKFYPADEKNDFRIEYKPENLPDGEYTLRVQGNDVAGNESGFEPYSINFQVINESTVTHFYPYPNPFSSKTRFVFTLTGSTIPQNLKIQIMTVTGKVVREIMKEELGPIKIGNNISEFAWDGTDEFGDKLANGVYLYRVIMETAEEFKHRGTKGDQAFKKDYGKIYILR